MRTTLWTSQWKGNFKVSQVVHMLSGKLGSHLGECFKGGRPGKFLGSQMEFCFWLVCLHLSQPQARSDFSRLWLSLTDELAS